MLVYKNAKICLTPDAKPKICVTPNAKTQTQVSGIWVALGPKRKFLALAMYISYCLCRFHLRWVANF